MGGMTQPRWRSCGPCLPNNRFRQKSYQIICDDLGLFVAKVHLAVIAYGLPEVFTMTGGYINDCTEAPTLIEKIDAAQVLIADKGFDSQIIRDKGEALGMSVVIPRKKNSIKGNKGLDWPLYKLRHLVENAFARLKHYRAVATRYDKLTRHYESIVSLACAFLWLPM